MKKIHIIIFYRPDGIEFVHPEIPAISDEDEVKDRVNLLNKSLINRIGMYGYITKDVI